MQLIEDIVWCQDGETEATIPDAFTAKKSRRTVEEMETAVSRLCSTIGTREKSNKTQTAILLHVAVTEDLEIHKTS
jgi:hypothetical protein